MDFFRERWYVLPVLSATLLVAALPPVELWPLAVVGLTPLFFAASLYTPTNPRRVAYSGALTGALLIFSLYYLTLFQFHWLPGSEGLVNLVRAGIIPATLGGAVLLALCLSVYAYLRGTSRIFNALLGGVIYVTFELIFNAAFQGYYTGVLGYMFASVPFVLSYASLGGVHLVSFLAASLSCLIAEIALRPPMFSVRFVMSVTLTAGTFLILGLQLVTYLAAPTGSGREFSLAIVQPGNNNEPVFENDASQLIAASLPSGADMVVYPLSLFDGVLYEDVPPQAPFKGASVMQAGAWAAAAVPRDTVLVTWDSVLREGTLYNTFEFWKRGVSVAEYKKYALHFLDSTPPWLEKSGIYVPQFAYEAGKESGPTWVEDLPVGALICSELVQDVSAASRATGSQLLLAIGSESMFLDDTIGAFSLRAAQFRAAQYNLPVVRASALGPSAVIGRDGRVLARAEWGKQVTLMQKLQLGAPRPTLYSYAGNTTVYVLLGGIFLGALWMRRRAIFPGTRGW